MKTGATIRSMGTRRKAALVVVALAVAWLIAFILSNTETVRVSFVFTHVRLSLIWVMLICAVLGILIGLVLPRWRGRRG